MFLSIPAVFFINIKTGISLLAVPVLLWNYLYYFLASSLTSFASAAFFFTEAMPFRQLFIAL